jgi:hypothetical protein
MSQTELPQPAPGTGRRFFLPIVQMHAACCAFRIAAGTAIDAPRPAARGMPLANFLRAPSGAA